MGIKISFRFYQNFIRILSRLAMLNYYLFNYYIAMKNIKPLEQKKIPDDFNKIKETSEQLYSTLGEVWCPFLKQKIIFNAKGKEHIKFKNKHRARLVYDQYIRFKLLKFAPFVIQDSNTLQGINETKIFELNRSNQRNEYILADVTYYEFIAVIERRIRIKIIIKQINNTQPYFWSIIPFWKQIKKYNKRKLYEGDSETE